MIKPNFGKGYCEVCKKATNEKDDPIGFKFNICPECWGAKDKDVGCGRCDIPIEEMYIIDDKLEPEKELPF